MEGYAPINIIPEFLGLPRWLSGKESTCQCRRHRFDPWVGKIPWRRKWWPTLAFLPGKFHRERSLVGYSPWGCKKSDTALAWVSMHTRSWASALHFRLSSLQTELLGILLIIWKWVENNKNHQYFVGKLNTIIPETLFFISCSFTNLFYLK